VAPGAEPVPVTSPRGRPTFVLPVLVGAAGGLAIGVSPHTTMVVTGALVSAVVLGLRLEWAALAVVGTAVFEDYLDLFSPWAWDWLVLLLVVAWAVRRAQGRLHPYRLLTTAVPAGLFAVALVLSAAVHPLGYAGGAVVGRYAELLAVLLVLADTLSGPLAPQRAARVYVWSCLLAAACGILTAVVQDSHRVVGPLALADDLAFFLLAAVPLLGTIRVRAGQPAWWVWAGLAVLLLALIGTQSRAAILALILMLVFSVATGMLSLRHASALMILVATGVAFLIALLPRPVGQALSEPQRYAETRISERNDVRQAALEMTRAHPLLGLGPGSFTVFNRDYRGHEGAPDGLDIDVAYSTVLEASAELGALGGVALMSVFVVPGAAAHRRWRRDGSEVTAATLLALGGLVVAALIESEQYLLPLWFMAAMAASLGHAARPRFSLFDDSSSGQVLAR
jgi:putative inorganic carbon (HCO3(-)) transporter